MKISIERLEDKFFKKFLEGITKHQREKKKEKNEEIQESDLRGPTFS